MCLNGDRGGFAPIPFRKLEAAVLEVGERGEAALYCIAYEKAEYRRLLEAVPLLFNVLFCLGTLLPFPPYDNNVELAGHFRTLEQR